MSITPSLGLHHVTAISGAPVENSRFYTETMGLRRVKKTVNFDDPGAFHLYYGDRLGQPGTALTFFAFANVRGARSGAGEARELAWHVPDNTLDDWAARLKTAGVAVTRSTRFERPRLTARDPHGFIFALVEGGVAAREPWAGSPLDAGHQLGGFAGIDIVSRQPAATARVLQTVLGYAPVGEDGGWQRFQACGAASGQSCIDVAGAPALPVAAGGQGSVHHIAFRARDLAHQAEMAEAARGLGLNPTEVIDRQYFESVYFREPGGVLFEIATDEPGFTVDEDAAELGQALRLPPRYEPRRAAIEAALPPLD